MVFCGSRGVANEKGALADRPQCQKALGHLRHRDVEAGFRALGDPPIEEAKGA